MASSLNDPVALLKEGKRLSSTTLLRWKPNYDEAAGCYDKAGNLFKQKKQSDQAVEAYKFAADCHHKAGNFYPAAKSVEQVGNLYIEMKKRPADIARVFRRCAEIFQEDGKPERGAEVLNKAIRTLEREYEKHPSDDLKAEIMLLYKEAIDVYDDKHHLSGDSLRSFNAYLVRSREYKECIQNLKKQITSYEGLKQPHNVWKCYLSVVVLHLKDDDWAAADDAHTGFLQAHPEYQETDECQIAQQMLDAFHDNDAKLLEGATKNNKLKFLEGQIAKVAMQLKLPGTGAGGAPAKSRTRREVDGNRAALFAGADDDDEGEGDANRDDGFEEEDAGDAGGADVLDNDDFT